MPPRARVFSVQFLCLATSAFALVYPLYVIRPFRHQSSSELTFALWIMRYRPAIESVCALVAIAVCCYCWIRLSHSRTRVLVGASALLVLACALLSRINVYEQMFHPAEKPSFIAINETKLAVAEPVIAISITGVARAYPVRIISYHHIINDTLAGEPVVATY